MLNELRRKTDDLEFTKETDNIKKNQSELNTITEIKIYTRGKQNRLHDAEEWIADLEDKVLEITQSEQQKNK